MNYPELLPRFLRYVSMDTQSAENAASFPSTEKQKLLLAALAQELRSMGIANVSMDEHGYVMAHIPANVTHAAPSVGFIAHVDTSPDMSGADISPQIVENYDGKDIILSAEKNIVLSPNNFVELQNYLGQTLITTRGTTLLGADDKAGVAEIMTAVQYLMSHRECMHGEICVAFTPDEEVGHGVDYFDVEKFGAKYAYTIDGGQVGELEYENFNAAVANITIQGRNIHPGYAKNKMLNALCAALELHSMLPAEQRPECTQDYEGFYHLTKLNGGVESASMQYIIRDHDGAHFADRKNFLLQCVAFLNKKYGVETFSLCIADQYYNMREKVVPHREIIDVALRAMEQAGVQPIIRPIRGGTDGARLSFMGLPCPNIFAGGHNFHGKYEFIPLESMHKAVDVILNIVGLFAKEC